MGREGGDEGGSAEKMEYLFDTEEGPQTSAKLKCQNQPLKKDLSHQNCDIDKALLHTMGATSNASVRITGQDIFWFFFFLSLS